MTTCLVDPVLCMALFVSDTPNHADLDDATVRDTVDRTLDRLGPDECYARAAEVFGDRPEVALDRIQWARTLCSRALTSV
ncbi:hypothetical protein ACFO1B_25310 [Dactylosporangium siamense]|uniref:Uncharacterized protein n=1 Tax=Dactylosporangium siamense TaxID=685454 RepID=A0A919UD11_9ACTN|nr:hypothetical protein [Dactylosporangium siamense]GIG47381.1 hypothetical protein Dsi01nite_054220 [Dactylosporangium siamense]